MSSQGERLRDAIRLAGYADIAAFAESIGKNPVTVRQHINRGKVPGDAAEIYVRKLSPIGVTGDWLLFNRGKAPRGLASMGPPKQSPPLGPARGVTVEVTHYVGAGDQVFPIEGDAPIGYTIAPPNFSGGGGAAAIRGDSMEPLFDDKDVIFYRGWEPPPRSAPRRPVILTLDDGRSLLKKILPGSRKGLYHLQSINPSTRTMLDMKVLQVARIWWVHFEGLDSADGMPAIEHEFD